MEQLKVDIVRLGGGNTSGQWVVKFGILFCDSAVEQYYEALLGTLKVKILYSNILSTCRYKVKIQAAKKRGIIDFEGQMLLKGQHDEVIKMITFPHIFVGLNKK